MSIFIPNKINVGYQNREGTYTGKLAYVIYYDERGKLRKETSWQNWRDKNIPNNEYENVPTEGFVLNKKVGGYKSDWNFRQTYSRIYDPRGFEFEITIDNLLWILECSYLANSAKRFLSSTCRAHHSKEYRLISPCKYLFALDTPHLFLSV